MKNSDYWKQRFAQLEQAQNGRGAAAFAEIEQQYKEAQNQLEGQIARWYQRFDDNNGITLAQAQQYLKGADLKEFKRGVRDYIMYGRENAFTGGWMKKLENASAKYHISKLEALKIQTQQSLEAMFSKQRETIGSAMSGVFESGFYHTAYELQKGIGAAWEIAGLDQSEIEKILAKPWAADGKNFFERIRSSKEKLISEIHSELTRSLMTGQDPQKVIDAVTKKMNTSKSNAARLVMTEEAFFSSAAQGECFEELGVEQYEILATLDSNTSDICQRLDGKVFPVKDYQAGVTAPPFHVNCRSTAVPCFKDDFVIDGSPISQNMSFEEWEKKFVKSDLTNGSDGGIIKEHRLAAQKTFSFSDYDLVSNSESIEKFKVFVAEQFGISHISGIELLENGDTTLNIVSPLKQLFEQYGKSFSRISVMDFGNSKTVAETLTNELRLNCQFMNRPDALKAVLDEWEHTGYIPKGCNNAAYVGRHEFFHLLTQDLINMPKSEIDTEVRRALKNGCEYISRNGKRNSSHEFVADLLAAVKTTDKQEKLKLKILNIIERGQ